MHGGWWFLIFFVAYLPFRWLIGAMTPRSASIETNLASMVMPDFILLAACIGGYFVTRKPPASPPDQKGGA